MRGHLNLWSEKLKLCCIYSYNNNTVWCFGRPTSFVPCVPPPPPHQLLYWVVWLCCLCCCLFLLFVNSRHDSLGIFFPHVKNYLYYMYILKTSMQNSICMVDSICMCIVKIKLMSTYPLLGVIYTRI